jgi:hypothetical protein
MCAVQHLESDFVIQDNGIVVWFVLLAYAVVRCAMVGTTTEEKWDTKGANKRS